MNTRPHKLEASIGGYPGPYYDVTLTNGELIYNCHDGDGPTLQPDGGLITPTEEAWAEFHSALDRAQAWQWQPRYEPDELIVDGTSWSVEIRWGDRTVKSQGSNAAPDSFDDFLRALRTLIGGRDFY